MTFSLYGLGHVMTICSRHTQARKHVYTHIHICFKVDSLGIVRTTWVYRVYFACETFFIVKVWSHLHVPHILFVIHILLSYFYERALY